MFLLAFYLLASLFGGIGLAWIAVHPPSRPITEAEYRKTNAFAQRDLIEVDDVKLTAIDGVVLRAWFMRPPEPNRNVIILLHGVSDNRLGVYPYAKWLLKNHYSVLLPDSRAHGLSKGLATYGLRKSGDIHQWVSWIEDEYHPVCVYGFGGSMGAAQLLQALPEESRFCAVVAECPFASFREVAYARFGRQFHTGPWLGSTLFRPTVEVGLLYIRLKYGSNMEEASPKQAVERTRVPNHVDPWCGRSQHPLLPLRRNPVSQSV